jgi:hypothetical protein
MENTGYKLKQPGSQRKDHAASGGIETTSGLMCSLENMDHEEVVE